MLTVYSKANCPFCDKAKNLLRLKGIEYTEVRVDQDPAAREFIISEGHRTVPQIYRDGQVYVKNGYNGLAALSDSDFKILKESQNVS